MESYKFAFLDTANKIIDIAVFDSENPSIELLDNVKNQLGATDYKSCLVYGEAAINGYFINDRFTDEKLYPSWVLNTETYNWEAPVPIPTEPYEYPDYYVWNENTLSWDINNDFIEFINSIK